MVSLRSGRNGAHIAWHSFDAFFLILGSVFRAACSDR
jgi:hypothetical protein